MALLSTHFPLVFKLPPVPLAIGIHQAIIEIVGGEVDPRELSIFMRYWTGRWSYLHAIHVEQRNQAGRALWGDRHQEIKEAAEVEKAA